MTQRNEKNLEIALYASFSLFFAGIAFKTLAWPYLQKFFNALYNAPPERTPLIQSLVPFSLDEKKMNDETVNDAESLKERIIVTENTLDSWKQLGLTVSIGETYSLQTLKKHYREKLLSTHPDKTKTNDTHLFLEIRAALKKILEAQTITHTIFSFGKEQLFSIFVPKGEAVGALAREFSQWEITCKDYIKHIQQHIDKQERLITVQQNCLTAEIQHGESLDNMLLRLGKIEETLKPTYYAHNAYQFHANNLSGTPSSLIDAEARSGKTFPNDFKQ